MVPRSPQSEGDPARACSARARARARDHGAISACGALAQREYQVTFARPVGAHLDSTGHGPTAQRKRKTKREIIRCLKRYIAREAYHALQADLADLGELRSPRPRHVIAITCSAGFIGRSRRHHSP
jgi:hypothetical protein